MASNTLINGMLRKEKAFREDIEWNQTNVMGFAARLAPGGALEGLLSSSNDDNENSNNVMQKYRQALKDLAHDNVDKDRQLTAYMTAVKKLGQQEEDSGGGAEEDIQAKLERAVQTERQALDQKSIPVTQEASYLELCTALGENQGHGTGGDDDDDDIAIVNMGGADSNEHSLKCPLTAALMEDPVKNKVCKHSYSRQAILQHIQSQRGGRCVCPVAGCTNKTLNASQLEDDKLTATLVRRLKKRQQLSQKSQHSAVQVDEDDDEEYDE